MKIEGSYRCYGACAKNSKIKSETKYVIKDIKTKITFCPDCGFALEFKRAKRYSVTKGNKKYYSDSKRSFNMNEG